MQNVSKSKGERARCVTISETHLCSPHRDQEVDHHPQSKDTMLPPSLSLPPWNNHSNSLYSREITFPQLELRFGGSTECGLLSTASFAQHCV